QRSGLILTLLNQPNSSAITRKASSSNRQETMSCSNTCPCLFSFVLLCSQPASLYSISEVQILEFHKIQQKMLWTTTLRHTFPSYLFHSSYKTGVGNLRHASTSTALGSTGHWLHRCCSRCYSLP
uniref:Uncharacterized protein n=1 Tax=Chelonoidis abingdonii TaxID=106734 RepID=A0A8C0GF74_CHEAB